jgi:hypothetical protein
MSALTRQKVTGGHRTVDIRGRNVGPWGFNGPMAQQTDDLAANPHAAFHLTADELEAGLDDVRAAPDDEGTVALIVRRPAVDQREVLAEAVLDPGEGLMGDSWKTRGSRHTPDGSAELDRQLNVMSARAVALFARQPDRRALAGDQLYLDLDLSEANLPPGTRLALGDAVIEVTEPPHTGCAKFTRRFGLDAIRLVNSPRGRELRLRGLCARVVRGGTVRAGDPVLKLA